MRSIDSVWEQITAAGRPEDLPSLRELRHAYLGLVLQACEGNKSRAARVLGVDVKTIHNHLREIEQENKPRRTMTDVARQLDKAMTMTDGADLRVGPDQAATWGVEPGHYRWDAEKREAVRIGDYEE